jgi:ArsR family metal-binding transcriptional regulator
VPERLIESYDVQLVTPECHPNAETFRAVVRCREDISEALPYLNATLGGQDYHHQGAILLWSGEGKKYAFRPHEIVLAPVVSNDEARQLAAAVVEKVNEVWGRRGEIEPIFEGKTPLPKALDLFKLLPKTNCKDCGFAGCLAFATALRTDSSLAGACPYLDEKAYREAVERAG